MRSTQPPAEDRTLRFLRKIAPRFPRTSARISTVGPTARKAKLVGVVNALYNISAAVEPKDISSEDGNSARKRDSPVGGARTSPFEHLLCAQPGLIAAAALPGRATIGGPRS